MHAFQPHPHFPVYVGGIKVAVVTKRGCLLLTSPSCLYAKPVSFLFYMYNDTVLHCRRDICDGGLGWGRDQFGHTEYPGGGGGDL